VQRRRTWSSTRAAILPFAHPEERPSLKLRLMKEPADTSDLPLINALLTHPDRWSGDAAFEFRARKLGEVGIAIEDLNPRRSIDGLEELMPAELSEEMELPWVLVAASEWGVPEATSFFAIHFSEPFVRPVKNKARLLSNLREKLDVRRYKPNLRRLLAEREFPCSGVALRKTGHILGIRVAQSVLHDNNDLLLPSHYIHLHSVSSLCARPHIS
jgi:hypothetical protein